MKISRITGIEFSQRHKPQCAPDVRRNGIPVLKEWESSRKTESASIFFSPVGVNGVLPKDTQQVSVNFV